MLSLLNYLLRAYSLILRPVFLLHLPLLTLSPFAYSLIFCLVFFEFRKIEFGSV